MTQPRRVASARTLAHSPPLRRLFPSADWATLGTDLCLGQWTAATESPICGALARSAHKRYPRRGRVSQRRQVSLCGLRRLRRRPFGIPERSRAASAADMEPEPQPEPVTLLVKSPNQRHRDLELSGDRGWSVSRLKAHLSRVYPERPRPEDQRLIYSGKLLLDHQCLQDLLPKEKRHVLHLVCNVKNPSKMPEASTKGAESTEQLDNTNQAQHPGDSSSDGLRQREVLRNLSPSGWENIPRPETVQQTFQGLGPGFSGYTTYGWLQLSWFQQIYARQYYMQYLAATAASGAFVPTPGTQEIPVVSTPAPAPIHNQFPAENQPANQNAAAQAVVNPGANQNLRMNAQGGPLVEEDDEINRDWLDWTYSAATFSVFLSILYFYSSLSRFLMVMGATVVMYLHHVGWFPFRQRPVQNFADDGPQEAANQDPNNNLQGGVDPEMEDPNRQPPDREVLDREHTSPSFMSTAWLVFKTFFASLLPEGPPALAN
ncbi:homocysteine-responsive endoplasmic reticulum-resident ubiquitin-like domain member 1 protein isoform X2 [Mastomys coucha]|uniref:homocysteine-responsive endoplasmic reticulum-resident ubiquitin-like domain member 1 protein isoform X2 n=1 Tax=Mastomys coucha TaxID=35658 RepID=UPI00126207FB|nr:homocysteine-responsive endoplasmic reticulum-resident ubiquitin-like domain member 1 protein isoform X2 [Mastomys coucha]